MLFTIIYGTQNINQNDSKADLWSIDIIIYQMITKHTHHDANRHGHIRHKQSNVMVVNKNNRNHDNNSNNIHMQQNTQDFVLMKQEAKEQNNKNVTSLPKKRKSQFHIHNVSNK